MSGTTRSSSRCRVPITTLASDDDISYSSDESSSEALDHRTVASDIPGTQSIGDHHQKATVPKKVRIEQPIIDDSQKQQETATTRETLSPNLLGNSMGSNTTSTSSQHHASNVAPSSSNYQGHKADSSSPKAHSVVLPEANSDVSPSTTYYKYRAQLTFGLKPNKDGVNVAQLFQRWIFSSCESIPDFSLVPYEEPDKGQQITSIQQVPTENPSFYAMYYHNHRVLQHGNLTGMVAFQCSIPWSKLKGARSTFFSWLRLNNVYLNQTKFQTSTLVACGFLVGAHPGYTRRDHAEEELRVRLKMEEEDIPYQLSARTISVPIVEDKPEKYSFQAVVVETSANKAASLRERFYSLDPPTKAHQSFPYTGKYQFVPILKSKEWTVNKILRLAKLHVQIINDLKPIFLTNLQDLRQEITPTGNTLMQGFYGMQFQCPESNPAAQVPLLHSIHNTGNKTTKVALVPSAHYSDALTQLSSIHSILMSNIAPEYQDRVFVKGARAGLTGQQIDSVSSCNCSSYASELLNLYNPQGGEEETVHPTAKRFRPVPMTYAAATNPITTAPTTAPTLSTSLSSLTEDDINQLYEKMKHHVDVRMCILRTYT
jgi:hypothetical protein